MTQLNKHPLLVEIHELMQQIERCGASPELTEAVIMADKIMHKVEKLYDKGLLKREAEASPDKVILNHMDSVGLRIDGEDVKILRRKDRLHLITDGRIQVEPEATNSISIKIKQ